MSLVTSPFTNITNSGAVTQNPVITKSLLTEPAYPQYDSAVDLQCRIGIEKLQNGLVVRLAFAHGQLAKSYVAKDFKEALDIITTELVANQLEK